MRRTSAGDLALPRRIRYQEIAAELRELVRDRAAGTLLPSESELSARFGASRVTVRRALEVVRDEGLVAARQGFGWFVATEPVRQRLEHLGTIEDQLEAGGRRAERRVTEFAFVDAPARVERVLGVDQVLRVKRVNLADGEPFAVVTVWCPAELGAAAVARGRRAAPVLRAARHRRCAARPRRSVPTPPSPPTPHCSACRSARRCCAASASPPTRPAGPC